MEIVLTQDVATLGRKGDVKKVKPGYFRNFLLPKRLAQVATEKRIKVAAKIREKSIIKIQELDKMAQEVREKLTGLTLKFKRKVTSKDKLYGAVKPKDLLDAIKDQAKVELKAENIELKSPIKTLGEHTLEIKLTDQIHFPLKINVLAE